MKVKLLIVTGYLGSGKTTLLRALKTTLRDCYCHFIVNEVGAIALDHASYELVEDQTSIVAGGCGCCVRKTELITSIKRIVDLGQSAASNYQDAYIVIETSGLANPAPIIFSITSDPYLQHHVVIEGVVCALGCVEGNDALTRYDMVSQQLAVANVVVMTKTDLVTSNQQQALLKRVQKLSPEITSFSVGYESVDWDAIITALSTSVAVKRLDHNKLIARTAFNAGDNEEANSGANGAHSDMSSCVLRIGTALDWVAFGVWLSALLAIHGESIVRVKGVIPVEDWRRERFFVLIDGVQHIMYPPQHIESDNQLPSDPALVFITRGISPRRLEHSLHEFYRQHVENSEILVNLKFE